VILKLFCRVIETFLPCFLNFSKMKFDHPK